MSVAAPVAARVGLIVDGLCAPEDHAVAVVDAAGRSVERFTVAHTAAGLRELIGGLRRRGAQEVAIEWADGQVVKTLLAAGLTVVVISPNQVKSLRSRYGQPGNKDDRFNAFVPADTLPTDRARLRTLTWRRWRCARRCAQGPGESW